MKKFILILFFILNLIPAFADEPIILPSVTGLVQNIEYVDDISQDVSQTKQIVDVKVLSGSQRGNIIQLENVLTGNPYYDINLRKNAKIILHAEDIDGNIEFSIENIKRSGSLLWLSLLFCGLLVYVGKKKGIYSIVAIGITVLLISEILSPLILFGINPVFASILVCILSTAVTMCLVGGFNAKSFAATLGAVLSLLFAGCLSYLTMFTANLSGFSNENSMFLYTAHPELNFVDITVSAMILATLGAVMDVAMSISSTINEISETDNTRTAKELFISGMNVGKDIIGTMANTLILVYLGGSLPLLLLAENIDLQKFINLNQVVTEISSALIGSIAIVICVPFTALVASRMIKNKKEKIEINL